jgi:hypothetical protein
MKVSEREGKKCARKEKLISEVIDTETYEIHSYCITKQKGNKHKRINYSHTKKITEKKAEK